jgi:hypothetical protein
LAELEAVIEAGLVTFVDVGQALLEIRKRRLYLEQGHASFEEYCRLRWGWHRRHAYRLIEAAEVVSALEACPMGHTSTRLPTNERQARELARVDNVEERAALWHELIREHPGGPTAAAIREKVDADSARRSATMRVMTQSESEEWYTPRVFVDAVRRVMGDIDLDPASCVAANTVVCAQRYYSVSDDGLTQPWCGRVFMNPPFGKEGPLFVGRLLHEYETGTVTEAVLLCAARIETQWYQPLFDYDVCAPRGRVEYWRSGAGSAPPFPSTFTYLGPNRRAFYEEFSPFGPILVRRRHPDARAA